MSHSKVLLTATSFLAAALSAASPSNAQDRPPGFEPLAIAPDGNGVDLLSGKITFPTPRLSIPANPLLSIGRIEDYNTMLIAFLAGSLDGATSFRNVKIHVRVGESTSESFDCYEGDCSTRSPRKSYILEGTAAGYFIFRQAVTGKTIIYNLKYATTPAVSGTNSAYYASKIIYANGETHDLEYDLVQWPGPSGSTLNVRRVTKVKSNRGYELRMTYATNVLTDAGWGYPTSAALYRRGEYMTPLSKMTYQGGVTDQLGNTWTGNLNNRISSGVYRPPTNVSDQMIAASTKRSAEGNLLTQLNKNGDIWNYDYSHAVPIDSTVSTPYSAPRDVTITGPNSYYRRVSVVDSRLEFPKIIREVDGLGKVTAYTYDGKQLTGVTYPEGNSIRLTYDLIGNVTKKESAAKPGSGIATITQTAGYSSDSNCVVESDVFCFRPLWVKDGKNNQTDYTWDPTFGDMLTETGPAGANGIRPKKRHEYTIRYAWYKNDVGNFIRSPTGISVKTGEKFCKATATMGDACAGGAVDEVVTTYDYGPDAAPNNLLLRGVSVTANGQTLRTCYTYDARGNKLSETKPLATGGTCP